jgi:hypothetical protein
MSSTNSRSRIGRSTTRLATIALLLSVSSAAFGQPDSYVAAPEPGGALSANGGEFTARIAPDGTVSLKQKPSTHRFGELDVTDILMRRVGMDPYASAKLDFLDRTRDMRVQMGQAYRDQLVSAAPSLMQHNIDAVAAAYPDPTQRKQALFALWDECAETGEPELVTAGNLARATVARYIQRAMTGPYAYTPSELARFNAERTSTSEFAPYADVGLRYTAAN